MKIFSRILSVPRTTVRQGAQSAAMIWLGLLAIAHFTVTLAFCLPATPVTLQNRAMWNWIYPYFQQNWAFFAPNPPTKDDYVMIQYRYRTRDGKLADSPWINLSRTLNAACQRNRLTSLEIVQLLVSNAYSDTTRSNIFQKGVLDEELLRKEIASNTQPAALHTLERVAMAFYSQSGIDGAPEAVRVAFLHHEFPRFTHRNDPDPQDEHNTVTTLPFVPFEKVAQL